MTGLQVAVTPLSGVGVGDGHFFRHFIARGRDLLFNLTLDEEVRLGTAEVAVVDVQIVVIVVPDPAGGVEAFGRFLVGLFKEIEENVLLVDGLENNIKKLRPLGLGTAHGVS